MHVALARDPDLADGRPVARCTTGRLMKQLGLRGVSRAKGPRTTISGSGLDTRPDLVERQFTAHAPNQLWVVDITYCRTFAGWVYAAFILDVFSRQVVGWQLSTSLRTDLALDALDMGLWTRQRASGLAKAWPERSSPQSEFGPAHGPDDPSQTDRHHRDVHRMYEGTCQCCRDGHHEDQTGIEPDDRNEDSG